MWLNKEKGIALKRVTITGIQNTESLHIKKDIDGNTILDKNGKELPVDFVNTGNNHHVAIYKDEKGNYQEEIVTFYEAVARKNANLPIVNKIHEKGWKFLFTMKQNEMFLFSNDGFEVSNFDLLNPNNAATLSTYLFRVQKIATKNYFFRHHLETTVENIKELAGYSYLPQLGLNGIDGIIKVRINHLGKIVQINE
jgi:CRISPR-associated endonuclease Csn1